MKIAWFCIPAHGHTNPTLAFVKEMTGAGHEIYYFSFEEFKEKIENAGAHFIDCSGYDFEMEDKDNADKVGKDMAFATELLVNSTLALDDMVNKKVNEIKPDLIVADSVAYWGKLTALKYNIPYVSSTTTFAFNDASSRYMNHGLGELAKMLFTMPKINKQLKRLQDKGYPVKNILDIVRNDNDTKTVVYTSSYFQPCSETFSSNYHFIGPSIRPIEKPFEKSDKKTVYVSMGTVVKNQDVYKNCIKALGNTDCRVIVSLGKSGLKFDDVPENFEIYDSVDQMAVLSVSDVFITHCGMNSVSEGLYFEVPLVLFPQTPEQGAVAKRTEELGAGIKLKSSSSEDIADSVKTVLGDKKYKDAAVKISESFKKCGGVKEAREFLESIVK